MSDTRETTGVPTVPQFQLDQAGAGDAGETRGGGRLRRVLRGANTWGELRNTPYGARPAILIALIGMLQVFETSVFSTGLPDITRDLGIDIGAIVGIRSVVGFFGIFAALLLGWSADRHRRVPLLGIGTILSGVFGVVSASARSVFTLGAARVVDEVTEQASGVPQFSLLADYYPPETRGRVFALLGVASNIGFLTAPLAGGALIVAFGWRWATIAFSVPLVVIGALALIYLREPARGYMERRALGIDDATALVEDEPQSFAAAMRTIWAVRTMRRVFFALIAIIGGRLVYGGYFGFFLAEDYGLDALGRAWVAFPATIAALLAGFLGGARVDALTARNPERVPVVFGALTALTALSVAVVSFSPPLAVIIAFDTVSAFGFALAGPAANVLIAQVIPPSVRSQGGQFIALAGLPALFIFAPAAQQIFVRYGFGSAILAAVPLFLIGAALIASVRSVFDLDMRSAFSQAAAAEEHRRALATSSGKLLVCRNVEVGYDGTPVLFGVDFDVDEGEIVALLGTNGAGKSTLLRAISGTQEASSGAILFDGRDITHMPPHEIAARRVVHMPGGRGIYPSLTVRENLLLGRWLDDADEDPAALRARLAEVDELFPILRERASETAGALSGGEQQMLALAQAFLAQPRLLMIDELSLGLAPAAVAELLEAVRALHRRGVTIIVVEQSVNIALTIAERAVFMEKGQVRFSGPTGELLDRPDILRAVYVKGTGDAVSASTTRRSPAAGVNVGRAVLEVDGLVKRYGGITAVDDVTFALGDGEVLGLIGPNGAGKTTVFDIISGYQAPDEGTIHFEGVDITAHSVDARARAKLIRRFQDGRLFPNLTVTETILVALEDKLEVRNPLLTMAQLPVARRAERRLRVRADRLIDLLSLGDHRDKLVRELSTGLRRIVDIACVFATEPRVVLLDEPSAGIAQAEAEGLAPLLLELRSQTGCSILIIEHSMSLIAAVSDELLALDRGRVLLRGRPEDVLNDERVIEAYLGTDEATMTRARATRA